MVTDDIEAEARRYTADPTRVDTATALLRAYVAERDALLAEVRRARELDAALGRLEARGAAWTDSTDAFGVDIYWNSPNPWFGWHDELGAVRADSLRSLLLALGTER